MKMTANRYLLPGSWGGPEGERTKVVQLGCGITGLVCAEQLERNPKVDELVLADAKIDAAKALAARIKSGKISTAKVDGTDSKELQRLLRGKDIVVSSMPWQLNRRVLDTAVNLGIDYVDFCLTVDSMDDFEKVRSDCVAAGITALTSTGEDPGISDVFAVHGASKLDIAEEAHVKDGDSGVAEGHDFFSLWSPIDLLEEVTVPAAIFKNGQMTYVPPLSRREVYDFPPPLGPLPVYNTSHEETYLMPRFIKGLRHADFQIAIDDNFAKTANMLRKIGLHSLNEVDVKGVKVRPLDVVVALLPRPVDLAGKVKGYACILVEVVGLKGNERTKVKTWTMMSHEKAFELCGSNATGYLVGVGGAVATEMLIAGEVREKGLVVPEQLPPDKFIARLPSKGLVVKQETVRM
jgi:saccharopine dehydrogenase (NAD+, L-lysine-forming)